MPMSGNGKRLFGIVLLTSIAALAFMTYAFGQEKTKHKPVERPARLEDAVNRAMLRVRATDIPLKRLTVLSGTANSGDDSTYVVCVEFTTNDCAFFQGFQEAKDDQFLFIPKCELDLVMEALNHGRLR